MLIEAAKKALDEWGFGMASVRFICGTQTLHQKLERAITEFLHPDDPDNWDTILYSSCFDANGGLFEVLLGPDDAIISDELNHASIIDGVRLCKAQRFRYRNQDMADLEAQLQAAKDCRHIMIATDGVSRWTGLLPRCRRSVTSPKSMVPWLWSTTPTLPGSSVNTAPGPRAVGRSRPR